jgi:hypothetical protein
MSDVIAMDHPNLSSAEIQELEELLTMYRDIFAMDRDDCEQTNRVYHHIDTGEAQPVPQSLRRHTGKLGRCGRDSQAYAMTLGYQRVRQPMVIPHHSRLEGRRPALLHRLQETK